MSGQAEMAHNTWASPQHGIAVSRQTTDVWTHAQEGEAMCYDMFGGWGHFIRWWWWYTKSCLGSTPQKWDPKMTHNFALNVVPPEQGTTISHTRCMPGVAQEHSIWTWP